MSMWTANQRRLVAVTHEVTELYKLCAQKGHDGPPDKVFSSYDRFRRWKERYLDDPESTQDPYKSYNQGWKMKRR